MTQPLVEIEKSNKRIDLLAEPEVTPRPPLDPDAVVVGQGD